MKSVRITRDTHRPGGRLVAGETVELPDGLADALCTDGRAEPVKSAPKSRSKPRKGARSQDEGTNAKPPHEER